MDNLDEFKELIKDLIKLLHKCCPPFFSNEMFVLETRAKRLGIKW